MHNIVFSPYLAQRLVMMLCLIYSLMYFVICGKSLTFIKLKLFASDNIVLVKLYSQSVICLVSIW